jgi:hypothetical protein
MGLSLLRLKVEYIDRDITNDISETVSIQHSVSIVIPRRFVEELNIKQNDKVKVWRFGPNSLILETIV